MTSGLRTTSSEADNRTTPPGISSQNRGEALEAAREADRAWREERAVELQRRIDGAHQLALSGVRVWQGGWLLVAGGVLFDVVAELMGHSGMALFALTFIGLVIVGCGIAMQRLGALLRRRLLDYGDREQLLVWDPARVLHPGDSP